MRARSSPSWSCWLGRPGSGPAERGTYTLDFRNHVRLASKKNFILEAADSTCECTFKSAAYCKSGVIGP